METAAVVTVMDWGVEARSTAPANTQPTVAMTRRREGAKRILWQTDRFILR
jgi:hypothetical protein